MTSAPRPALLTPTTAATAGCIATALALVILWAARASAERPMYVSALGADGEPTAGWFRVALLLISTACALIAWAGRGRRSAHYALSNWSISTSVAAAGALFFVVSQVPCTSGCPLPAGANAMQDLTHTGSAVLAFGAGGLAMLQAATTRGDRALRWLSLGCGTSVVLLASTGGILSLLRVATDLGGLFEFVATSIGLGWLIVFGATVARSEQKPRRAPVDAERLDHVGAA